MSASVHAGIHPPSRHTHLGAGPPGNRHTPRSRHPPGVDTPLRSACSEIWATSGRYASYWNAYLLVISIVRGINKVFMYFFSKVIFSLNSNQFLKFLLLKFGSHLVLTSILESVFALNCNTVSVGTLMMLTHQDRTLFFLFAFAFCYHCLHYFPKYKHCRSR